MKNLTYYICIGNKGVMYTLREDLGGNSRHIKTLSNNRHRAEQLAIEYIDKLNRINEGTFQVSFQGFSNSAEPFLKWGEGKMDKRELYKLKMLLNGIFAFGKYNGKPVQEVPIKYLCWVYQESAPNSESNKFSEVLSSTIFAELINRGFIKNNADFNEYMNKCKQNKIDLDINSNFVGSVNDRIELNAAKIIFLKSEWDSRYNQTKYFYKLKVDEDVFIYSGTSALGELNQSINFKATIKEHKLYENVVKTTLISRPSLI